MQMCPRIWLLFATAALAACADRPLPAAAQLPEDALVDEPAVGLTEPRVTVMTPVAGAAMAELPAPAFAATSVVGMSPAEASSVSELREVILEIDVVGQGRRQLLSVEILSPGGMPYEARETYVGGDPYALYRAQFILPVAGTAIDRSNLAGVWTARYFLAGRALTSTTFELEP